MALSERGRSAQNVLAAVAQSALATGRLAMTGRLAQPPIWVGNHIEFSDGTTSTVFRETVRRDGHTDDPCLLVVEFRLALIGQRPWTHAVFRRTCIVNTPLFAGFPGFRSKLWLADPASGVYRGVYEWDGEQRAIHYAETLRHVLALVSIPDSIHYRVVPGIRRDAALADPARLGGPDQPTAAAWWRPRAAETPLIASRR